MADRPTPAAASRIRPATRTCALALVAALALLLAAGCGDDGDADGPTPAGEIGVGAGQAEDGAGGVGADSQAINTLVGVATSIERCARRGGGEAGPAYGSCGDDTTARTLADQAAATGIAVEIDAREDGYEVTATSETGATYSISATADALQATCTGGHDCAGGTFGESTGALLGLRSERGEDAGGPGASGGEDAGS